MAHLPCDRCGGPSGTFGSWDCPMTIVCGKCQEKEKREKEEREKKLEIAEYKRAVAHNISKL